MLAKKNDAVSPEAYDTSPWYYDARGYLILRSSYRDGLLSQILFFSKNLSDQHLEAAIGSGTLTSMIFRWARLFGKEIKGIGFDYTPEMVAGAKAKLNSSDFSVIQADAKNLPFESNKFKTINLANSFHAMSDPELILKEFYRVLAADGTFAMNVLLYPIGNSLFDKLSNRVNSWGMKKGILYTPYNQTELEKMIKNEKFDIIYSKRKGNGLYLVLKK